MHLGGWVCESDTIRHGPWQASLQPCMLSRWGSSLQKHIAGIIVC